ncbi:hypothetical protein D9M70_647340 [compost metagenome]
MLLRRLDDGRVLDRSLVDAGSADVVGAPIIEGDESVHRERRLPSSKCLGDRVGDLPNLFLAWKRRPAINLKSDVNRINAIGTVIRR